jgi:predicted Zn-dependent peptidase
MRHPFAWIALALLFVGCATTATKGLLEGDVPLTSLAKEGDLGFGRLALPAHEMTLPSGLRIAYETSASRKMVAVIMTLDVGSTADPEDHEGLAHYAEHLAFRNRPRGRELAIELERLGAVYNATTSLDATTFYAVGPSEALPGLIDLMVGLLQKPLQSVAPDDATVELEVLRSEFAFRNETGVYGQVRGWLQSLLLEASHPYRRPTGGTSASIERLTLAAARSFVDAHYKPAKATLLVAGDIDGERLDELLKQRLPAALRGDPAAPVARHVEEVPLLEVTVPAAPPIPPRHQAAVALPELWVGYLMPGKFSRNVGNTLLVASRATEQGLRDLLQGHPHVLGINVVPLHDRLSTILAIQVVLSSPERRDEIAAEVRRTMGMMWQPADPTIAEAMAKQTPPIVVRVDGRYVLVRPTPEFYRQIQADNLLRQRSRSIGDALNGLEPWTARALERAEYLRVIGKPGAVLWATDQTSTVDEAKVAEFSRQYLGPDRARTAYIDPLPGDRRPAASRTGVSDRPIADDGAAATVYEPPFFAPAPLEMANIRRVQLNNGLQVVVVKRSAFPSIAAVLGFGGGAASAVPFGTVDLLRRLESYAGMGLPLNGVEASIIDGPSFTGDLVRAGAGNLSNALYLLAQRIVDTDKTDWGALLGYGGNGGSFGPRASPSRRAELVWRKVLYGNHPLGRDPDAAIPNIGALEMATWLVRMRSPRNAILIIAGNVELDEGERLARAWFGSWTGVLESPSVALKTLPSAPETAGLQGLPMFVDRDSEAQVQLVLACRLPPAGPQARASYDLLSSVVGSYINTMVRHRAGAAYSVASSANLRGGGAADLVVTMEVETRRLPEALAGVRSLWKRLATDGFDEGAVSQSRWTLATSYNLRYQTSAEVAVSLFENWSLGWSIDTLTSYPEQILRSGAADLKAAFESCRTSTVSLVVGKASLVRPMLINRK